MNTAEIDRSTGYYRSPGVHNARLTEVGRGTPTGELMRRYCEEHLATSDRAIVMLRRLFEAQVKAVEEGGDPIGVHFDPGQEYVHLAGGSFVTRPAVSGPA